MAAPASAVSRTASLGIVRAVRAGAIGHGTGILAGAVVGGIGGRILMRILFLENEGTNGGITENGNEVGGSHRAGLSR